MELDISHTFKNFTIFYEAGRFIGMLRRTRCWLIGSKRETKRVVTSFPSSTHSLVIIVNNPMFVSGRVIIVSFFFLIPASSTYSP